MPLHKKSEKILYTEILEIMSHVNKMMAVYRSHGFRDIYYIKTKMSEFQERDSAWALRQISILEHQQAQYSSRIELLAST